MCDLISNLFRGPAIRDETNPVIREYLERKRIREAKKDPASLVNEWVLFHPKEVHHATRS